MDKKEEIGSGDGRMTELKTLNDLEEWKDYDDGLGGEIIIRKNEIKQEAIKWMKSIDNPLNDRENMEKLSLLENTKDEAENCLFGARRFIIHFFNITEEEIGSEK